MRKSKKKFMIVLMFSLLSFAASLAAIGYIVLQLSFTYNGFETCKFMGGKIYSVDGPTSTHECHYNMRSFNAEDSLEVHYNQQIPFEF